jgi:hypothetical protein
MKGYYDERSLFKALTLAIIFIITIMWVYQAYGMIIIDISVSGQPTIDSLEHSLDVCNSMLDEKCEPCPECVCKDMGFGGFFHFLFGTIVGFMYFLWFGEGTKKWMLKRLKRDVKEAMKG